MHQLGKKMLRGNFMGYVLRAKGTKSGDLPVADCEDLENVSACDSYVRISVLGSPMTTPPQIRLIF